MWPGPPSSAPPPKTYCPFTAFIGQRTTDHPEGTQHHYGGSPSIMRYTSNMTRGPQQVKHLRPSLASPLSPCYGLPAPSICGCSGPLLTQRASLGCWMVQHGKRAWKRDDRQPDKDINQQTTVQSRPYTASRVTPPPQSHSSVCLGK